MNSGGTATTLRERVTRSPVTGLALSGGGARGLAHIGVLKVLEEAGITIDVLSGTSMGGIIATLAASGMSAKEMEAKALEMAHPRRMLKVLDLDDTRSGLFSGSRVRDFLVEMLGEELTFDDLAKPLALTAVDLITGQEVLLDSGPLAKALQATAAFPAVFEPVEIGPYRLVDGGVLNNLPVDYVRMLGAEVVIAVNVALKYYDLEMIDNPKTLRPTRIAHNAWRSQSLTSMALVNHRLAEFKPEVIIHPTVPAGVSAFNGFRKAAEIIAAGEEAARAALDEVTRTVRPRVGLAWRLNNRP